MKNIILKPIHHTTTQHRQTTTTTENKPVVMCKDGTRYVHVFRGILRNTRTLSGCCKHAVDKGGRAVVVNVTEAGDGDVAFVQGIHERIEKKLRDFVRAFVKKAKPVSIGVAGYECECECKARLCSSIWSWMPARRAEIFTYVKDMMSLLDALLIREDGEISSHGCELSNLYDCSEHVKCTAIAHHYFMTTINMSNDHKHNAESFLEVMGYGYGDVYTSGKGYLESVYAVITGLCLNTKKKADEGRMTSSKIVSEGSKSVRMIGVIIHRLYSYGSLGSIASCGGRLRGGIKRKRAGLYAPNTVPKPTCTVLSRMYTFRDSLVGRDDDEYEYGVHKYRYISEGSGISWHDDLALYEMTTVMLKRCAISKRFLSSDETFIEKLTILHGSSSNEYNNETMTFIVFLAILSLCWKISMKRGMVFDKYVLKTFGVNKISNDEWVAISECERFVLDEIGWYIPTSKYSRVLDLLLTWDIYGSLVLSDVKGV